MELNSIMKVSTHAVNFLTEYFIFKSPYYVGQASSSFNIESRLSRIGYNP